MSSARAMCCTTAAGSLWWPRNPMGPGPVWGLAPVVRRRATSLKTRCLAPFFQARAVRTSECSRRARSVVAALQDQHRSGADAAHLARHRARRRRRQAEAAQRVVAVGVEAGRDDQEPRVEDREAPAGASCSNASMNPRSDEPAASRMLTVAPSPAPPPRSARLPSPDRTGTGGARRRARPGPPEDGLGAVAVVGVPVEHRHALDARGPRAPPRRLRGSPGEAHRRAASAWWPGGRPRQNAAPRSPASTASTAAVAAPDATTAAS